VINISPNENTIITEKDIVEKVAKFFQIKGWKIIPQVKVRGRIVDLVAVKDQTIALIEVKGTQGNPLHGIGQAVHQSTAADYSYLALPSDKVEEVEDVCAKLGIGLLAVNSKVNVLVKPRKGTSLPSVRSMILKIKPKVKQPPVEKRPDLVIMFGSETRVEILKLLLLNPDTSFYIREISSRVGLAFSMVYKELANLKDLGLVIEERKGKIRLFKINNQSLLYEDLKMIFIKTVGLGDIITEHLQKFDKIRYAFIYGSFARGQQLKTSDVDLLIVGDLKEEKLIKAISEMEESQGREINYILWSEREFEKRAKTKHHLLAEIADNPVIGLVGDVDEFRQTVKG